MPTRLVRLGLLALIMLWLGILRLIAPRILDDPFGMPAGQPS
jgi:hypothetical protein